MTRWRRALLILVITAWCVGCDQSTKIAAKTYLPPGTAWSFAGDTLRFHYAENKGAFLGLGSTLPEAWRAFVFVGATALLLGCLWVYLLSISGASLAAVASWSLIGAGGLSNLVDRVLYGGYVVDFINVGVGNIRTGVFNLADLAIACGVIFLVAARTKAASDRPI